MIVGGMTFGTLLTLFVVPCVYSVMGRRAAQSRGRDGHSGGRGTSRLPHAAE